MFRNNKRRIFLNIAGSDCSGGAGIQADLKVAYRLGLYGCTAITAITVQNSFGFTAVNAVDLNVLEAQLEAIGADFTPDAVKIGLLPGAEAIKVVASALRKYNFRNVVLDPVLAPTLGKSPFMSEADIRVMIDTLFPLVSLITPNENEWQTIKRIAAGRPLSPAVLVTNGDVEGSICREKLFKDGETSDDYIEFNHDKIVTHNSHGTGCVFSSAIACGLANGLTMPEAVDNAVKFVAGCLDEGKDVKLCRGYYGPAMI